MVPTCSNCKRDHATFYDERRNTMAKTTVQGVTEACEACEWLPDGLVTLAEAEACEACG
ncbi:hypothetical protein Tco_0353876, partial [Tanacetum coccineum]